MSRDKRKARPALTHSYDAKNRLTKTQMGAIATDTVTYKINTLGQRVQKTGAGAYLYSNVATIDAAGHSPTRASCTTSKAA